MILKLLKTHDVTSVSDHLNQLGSFELINPSRMSQQSWTSWRKRIKARIYIITYYVLHTYYFFPLYTHIATHFITEFIISIEIKKNEIDYSRYGLWFTSIKIYFTLMDKKRIRNLMCFFSDSSHWTGILADFSQFTAVLEDFSHWLF